MSKFFARLVYFLFVRPWLVYIVGVRFVNRDILDKTKQCIFVANHNSHFDALSIMAALPPKSFNHTKTVAAADYFDQSRLSRALMKFFFNACLISRQRSEQGPSMIDQLDQELKSGFSLILFPEGSRGRPGVVSNFHKGIAVLLMQNPKIPFVPIYLDGFGRVLPKGQSLIIPLVCQVRFGEPVYVNSTEIGDIMDTVTEEIFKLKEKDERDHNRFTFK